MSEQELQQWLQDHEGYGGVKENYRNVPASTDMGVDVPAHQVLESITYTAVDGATLTVKEGAAAPTGGTGPRLDETDAQYTAVGETPPKKDTESSASAESRRASAASAASTEQKSAADKLEADERSWNQSDPRGSGIPETHLERAKREAEEKQRQRAEQDKADALRRQQQLDADKNASDAADRAERARQANQSAGLTQQQLDEQRRQNEYTRNKPEFLPGDSKNPRITVYNPATGTMEALDNPNFDAVKDAAEQRRLELASQVQSGQLQLEAAKQQYTQWFDTNVKTPLMLSQEARAKAEEKRQALEAEERRRQFASDFSLRKATLGQAAGQDASQNEISLLPYRSGPTWGADISDAINSLAGGGNLANDASAGIHFSDSSFAFKRPDFKQIAKDATKAVLSGLTDYRPSDEQFATGDYSGVPAVNLGGAPAPYTFNPGGAALPPPSPEYTE
jgi:hypothetical protein